MDAPAAIASRGVSEQSGGPGWWLASDDRWYPPVPPSLVPSSDAQPIARAAPAGPPERGDHYDATVNKGSLNMLAFTAELNRRWKQGWRLGQVFEQKGNTVIVWERRPLT